MDESLIQDYVSELKEYWVKWVNAGLLSENGMKPIELPEYVLGQNIFSFDHFDYTYVVVHLFLNDELHNVTLLGVFDQDKKMVFQATEADTDWRVF